MQVDNFYTLVLKEGELELEAMKYGLHIAIDGNLQFMKFVKKFQSINVGKDKWNTIILRYKPNTTELLDKNLFFYLVKTYAFNRQTFIEPQIDDLSDIRLIAMLGTKSITISNEKEFDEFIKINIPERAKIFNYTENFKMLMFIVATIKRNILHRDEIVGSLTFKVNRIDLFWGGD